MNSLYLHWWARLVWEDKNGFIGYLIFRLQPTRRKKRGFLIDSTTFKYRRKITIMEESGSDLTDYQVLIELNNSNFDFSRSQTNGEDIRFTDVIGNLLEYWIEEWDVVNEIAKVWVKVPSIPANDTAEIYMYYGNSEITDASDASATFIRVIDGVVGSWHFDEGEGATVYDSSGNDNDGTIHGATWVDGKFGKALEFDGVDDYVEINEVDNTLTPGTGDYSIVVWFKLSSESSEHRGLVSKGGFQTNGAYTTYIYYSDHARWYSDGSNYVNGLISGLNDDQWHHIVFTRSGDVHSIYVDGAFDNSEILTDVDITSQDPVIIGARRYGTEAFFLGLIDEVCIFNKSLSADEISDLYNNYGYTTENYPGKVLVREYTEPEPSVSVGAEETA